MDTQLDTVTSSWGQRFDGGPARPDKRSPRFANGCEDTIWSSPAIGDGRATASTRSSSAAIARAPARRSPATASASGGYRMGIQPRRTVRWSYFVRDAVVWSSPALIDLNRDGALDVVVGTGLSSWAPPRAESWPSTASGQLMWDAPTGGPVLGSPAVAKVNGAARVWVVSGGGS